MGAKIIAIVNHKGGVGKSTTAAATGTGLMSKGKQVLLVDLDPQRNLSRMMGANDAELTVMDVLVGKVPAQQAIVKPGLWCDILPSGRTLFGAESALTKAGGEYALKRALASCLKSYDYIVIDTPPALGILTLNALAACDCAVIPAEADIFSAYGILDMAETIAFMKQHYNKKLKIAGILLTRHKERSVIARDLTESLVDVAGQLDTSIFATRIRECVALKEAQAVRSNIYDYAPKSNAAADYSAYVDELLERMDTGSGK